VVQGITGQRYTIPTEAQMKLAQYQIDAIKRGYHWECSCGEIHRTEQSARICRKCIDRDQPVDLRKFLEAT
jgi:hypothetical protein